MMDVEEDSTIEKIDPVVFSRQEVILEKVDLKGI
jgi:hypothetical protein